MPGGEQCFGALRAEFTVDAGRPVRAGVDPQVAAAVALVFDGQGAVGPRQSATRRAHTASCRGFRVCAWQGRLAGTAWSGSACTAAGRALNASGDHPGRRRRDDTEAWAAATGANKGGRAFPVHPRPGPPPPRSQLARGPDPG